MTYVSIPIETDESLVAADAFDFLTSTFPGWTPSEGQLDTWIILAAARIGADLRDQASVVSTDIFRYFGPLIGILPDDDIPATALSDWTLTDTAGHLIELGTRVGIYDDNLDIHEFTVTSDVTVPAGSNIAVGVGLVAANPGIDQNGLGGVGVNVVPLDDTVWVSSIILQAATSGGQDAEDDDTYLSKLKDTLTTMAPRPIIPNDFAVLARSIDGVGRSVALDGYDPGTATYGNEREVTVAVTDANGAVVASGIKTDVDNYLQSLREINFVVNVVDPTFTTVDFRYDATVWPNFDIATVQSDIDAAIQNFLNPRTWGTPPGDDPNNWYDRPTIKINDVIAAIGSISGLKDINSLVMRTGVGSYSSSDINMLGPASLPQVGTINAGVTNPVHY